MFFINFFYRLKSKKYVINKNNNERNKNKRFIFLVFSFKFLSFRF